MAHWTRIRLGAHQDHFLLGFHKLVMVLCQEQPYRGRALHTCTQGLNGLSHTTQPPHVFCKTNHTIRSVLLLTCKACDGQRLHGGHSHDDLHGNQIIEHLYDKHRDLIKYHYELAVFRTEFAQTSFVCLDMN